ncbi:hypothetical protein Q8A73_004142 [Channa argus]|nr:hypothetical protein Q8A73_004142 [Channa argus]
MEMVLVCAFTRGQLSDGADAGNVSAPWQPGARFYYQSGQCGGCLCASSQGSPPANRAPYPEPASAADKHTSVRLLHGCRCRYRRGLCNEVSVPHLDASLRLIGCLSWRNRRNPELFGLDEGRVAHRIKYEVPKLSTVRRRGGVTFFVTHHSQIRI